MKSDAEILHELHDACGGTSWKYRANWCTSAPLALWDRVEPDDDAPDRVAELYLYENNLVGTLPASLGLLRNLRVLHLNGNNLEGEVPRELLQLRDAGLEIRFFPGNTLLRLPRGFCSLDLPQHPFYVLPVETLRQYLDADGAAGDSCLRPLPSLCEGLERGLVCEVVQQLPRRRRVLHVLRPRPRSRPCAQSKLEIETQTEAQMEVNSTVSTAATPTPWTPPVEIKIVRSTQLAYISAPASQLCAGTVLDVADGGLRARVWSEDGGGSNTTGNALLCKALRRVLGALPDDVAYVWLAYCCLPKASPSRNAEEDEAVQARPERVQFPNDPGPTAKPESARELERRMQLLSLPYYIQCCGAFAQLESKDSKGVGVRNPGYGAVGHEALWANLEALSAAVHAQRPRPPAALECTNQDHDIDNGNDVTRQDTDSSDRRYQSSSSGDDSDSGGKHARAHGCVQNITSFDADGVVHPWVASSNVKRSAVDIAMTATASLLSCGENASVSNLDWPALLLLPHLLNRLLEQLQCGDADTCIAAEHASDVLRLRKALSETRMRTRARAKWLGLVVNDRHSDPEASAWRLNRGDFTMNIFAAVLLGVLAIVISFAFKLAKHE